MLYAIRNDRFYETGFAPLLALWPAAKWLAAQTAVWVAADFAITELTSTAEEASEEAGAAAGLQVTSGYRAQTLQQIDALEERGKKTLKGTKYLALYLALVADARKAIKSPSLTVGEAVAFRFALYNYTLKHGDCSTFKGEKILCDTYRKKHGGSSAAPKKARVPGLKTAPAVTTIPSGPSVPLIIGATAAAALVAWLLFK